MNKMNAFSLIYAFAILVSASSHAGAQYWRPERISAEIRRDDRFLKMGQYLYLKQHLDQDEHGWIDMKIDLPESWIIRKVSMLGGAVAVETANYGTYRVNGDNLPSLDFEILDSGAKSDDELSGLWRKHAMPTAK